jgi:hypothetical protein
MVELIINDIAIELPEGTEIKYTKQISDIFDIAKTAVSFTNSFEFDKTPENTQAMQQLGISGDTSNVPYQKNTTQLKVDGFDLVSQGWFNVLGTNQRYKGSILDGMVDFFRAIENKTMGNDLDLSNFEHQKTMENVIASWTNDYYRYLLADYGGKNFWDDGINIDYQTPSFSVRKLWELIFSTFGFNCDFTNLDYINNLYITYPKDVTDNTVTQYEIADLLKNAYFSYDAIVVGDTIEQVAAVRQWSSSLISEGSLLPDGIGYSVPDTSSYTFEITNESYVTYGRSGRANRSISPSVYVLKNGVVIDSIISDYADSAGEERTKTFVYPCDAGDVITVKLVAPRRIRRRPLDNKPPFRMYGFRYWRNKNTQLKVYKSDLGTTVLKNELKDFSIKDFIKEMLWRTGLTPIYNFETNTVEFKTLDSRVHFDDAQDLSHAFVSRDGEIYTNGYAQKNIFALKKNNDLDETGDGFLYVQNANLEDYKTIVQSKIYGADKSALTPFGGFSSNQYKIWEAETSLDEDDNIIIDYKGLSGRFYFVRSEPIIGARKITSEKLNDSEIVASFMTATNENTLFEEAISNNYQEYQRIFNNFRIHNIRLALTVNDFIGLDLTRPVFFKQENAYYICSKVPFEEGKQSSGEFIKINKV